MIKCKTKINKKTIKALAKYHMTKQKKSKSKKIFMLIVSILLVVLSIISTYGYWQKYYVQPLALGQEPAAIWFIVLRSSVFILFSFIIILSNTKGTEHALYKELKKYFKQTGTYYLEYAISKEGIRLKTNDTATMYEWNTIERMHSDDTYYYFTSGGKHSIIAKASISEDDMQLMDEMMKSINKDNLEIVL